MRNLDWELLERVFPFSKKTKMEKRYWELLEMLGISVNLLPNGMTFQQLAHTSRFSRKDILHTNRIWSVPIASISLSCTCGATTSFSCFGCQS